MNVGTRKTLVSFVLMLLARTAGAEGSGAPPWQESFTARLGGTRSIRIDGEKQAGTQLEGSTMYSDSGDHCPEEWSPG